MEYNYEEIDAVPAFLIPTNPPVAPATGDPVMQQLLVNNNQDLYDPTA